MGGPQRQPRRELQLPTLETEGRKCSSVACSKITACLRVLGALKSEGLMRLPGGRLLGRGACLPGGACPGCRRRLGCGGWAPTYKKSRGQGVQPPYRVL